MTQESSPNPEIDLSQFPDWVSCNIMPQVYMHYVVPEVEITDAEGQQIIVEVPEEAVHSFGVHHVYHGLPEELREPFKDHLATGIVACRVVERFEDNGLVRIGLPTKSEVSEILIQSSQLGRKV